MTRDREHLRALDVAWETLGAACRSFVSLSAIDRLFLQCDCARHWWTENGYISTGSERFDRLLGWSKGIRRHALAEEASILQCVCQMLLAGHDLDYQVKRQIQLIIAQFGSHESGSTRLTTTHIDQRVLKVSGKLFADVHYKEAAREALVAVIAAVREASGWTGGMDKDLMIQAFKEDGGLLRIADDASEQQGYM